jgi:hypothetical protein
MKQRQIETYDMGDEIARKRAKAPTVRNLDIIMSRVLGRKNSFGCLDEDLLGCPVSEHSAESSSELSLDCSD